MFLFEGQHYLKTHYTNLYKYQDLNVLKAWEILQDALKNELVNILNERSAAGPINPNQRRPIFPIIEKEILPQEHSRSLVVTSNFSLGKFGDIATQFLSKSNTQIYLSYPSIFTLFFKDELLKTVIITHFSRFDLE